MALSKAFDVTYLKDIVADIFASTCTTVHLLQRVKLEQVGFSVEGLYLGYPEHTLSTRRPLAYLLTWQSSTLASDSSASDVT